MQVRGKNSVLSRVLAKLPRVPNGFAKAVANGLRSDGFGLTCAQFEGAGIKPGNTWKSALASSKVDPGDAALGRRPKLQP
jgi:hypothetical protein